MEHKIKTVSDVVDGLKVTSLDYADDIGLDEKDGIGVSGYIDIGGENVKIIGSVVIENNSPVINDEDTSFHAYPNGLAYGSEQILDGTKAVIAMKKICNREKLQNHPL